MQKRLKKIAAIAILVGAMLPGSAFAATLASNTDDTGVGSSPVSSGPSGRVIQTVTCSGATWNITGVQHYTIQSGGSGGTNKVGVYVDGNAFGTSTPTINVKELKSYTGTATCTNETIEIHIVDGDASGTGDTYYYNNATDTYTGGSASCVGAASCANLVSGGDVYFILTGTSTPISSAPFEMMSWFMFFFGLGSVQPTRKRIV